MQKLKLTISYDGSGFQGSQIQPKKETVHGTLLKALKYLNINETLEFSGRTDKEVHAFRQVVSLPLPSYLQDTKKLQKTLNELLPKSIYVRNAQIVNKEFHARFSAKSREYRYIFTNKRLSPFESRFLSHYSVVEEEKINDALKLFVGTHDFAFFSKTGSDPKSTIRTIEEIKLYKYKELYILRFRANSYLRSQIRMMVDFIMKISQGGLDLDDLRAQLECKKKVSTTLASPSGLYLSKIVY